MMLMPTNSYIISLYQFKDTGRYHKCLSCF